MTAAAVRALAPLRRAAGFRAALALLVVLPLAAQLASIAQPDMAFLLYAAGRVLDGATLYRDVVEINPPLIVGFNAGVVALARALHLSDFAVYRLVTALVVGALLCFAARLLARWELPGSPAARRYLVLALGFVLFALPRKDFGQREHFVLALLLPYLCCAAARLEGRAVGPRTAVAAGALAAVGIALKPHFVLAWLAAEACVRVVEPRLRSRLTPEAATAALGLVAYLLAVPRYAPGYVEVATLLGPAYQRYLGSFLNASVFAPGAALIWFAPLAALALRAHARAPRVWLLLSSAVGGCYLAGVVQGKGLPYHFYPAVGLGFVLVALIALEAPRAARSAAERIYARAAPAVAGAVVLVCLGAAALQTAGGGPGERRFRREFMDLVSLVRSQAQGGPVGVLSFHIASAFPLVNYAGVPLASRFPHLWLLPASYWDSLAAGGALRYRAPEDMDPAERFLYQSVHDDLLAARPRLLLVLEPARDVARNGLRRLHYIQYFGRQPDLAVLFSRYELIAHRGEYAVYRRLEPGAERSGPAPSFAPGDRDVVRGQMGVVRLGLLDPEMLAGAGLFLLGWYGLGRRGGRGRVPRRAPLERPLSPRRIAAR